MLADVGDYPGGGRQIQVVLFRGIVLHPGIKRYGRIGREIAHLLDEGVLVEAGRFQGSDGLVHGQHIPVGLGLQPDVPLRQIVLRPEGIEYLIQIPGARINGLELVERGGIALAIGLDGGRDQFHEAGQGMILPGGRAFLSIGQYIFRRGAELAIQVHGVHIYGEKLFIPQQRRKSPQGRFTLVFGRLLVEQGAIGREFGIGRRGAAGSKFRRRRLNRSGQHGGMGEQGRGQRRGASSAASRRRFPIGRCCTGAT